MIVIAKIDPVHIHHFIVDSVDILQFDVSFPAYPDLPTYGLSIEAPFTKQKVIDAVTAQAIKTKEQILRDDAIKALLTDEILSFEVDI